MLKHDLHLAQLGDENSKLNIINRFYPLIKKYSNKLYDDDYESFFIISLLSAIGKFKKDCNNTDDGQIVSYFNKVIKNTYIDEVKKRKRCIDSICQLNDGQINDIVDTNANYTNEVEFEIYLYQIVENLTKQERDIIIAIFLHNKSEKSLALEYSISKQAVSNAKKKAKEKLKHILKGEIENGIWSV